ncbi:probable aquaporin NIP7-1 [Cynara cardunculus var. scolymus]|uniref:Aquaporin-like protein n=1 Tax=Cynara cardunculus var. scolymus TaxID=59895 RepID=A0A103Y338_CYNCS|nr:probable aquaporin NIP7-1 [Cynara cardunculus var. scolymus]KVI01655.1 Aquaporin-like protein [Cynara cardunculus var. scolymus]
MTGLFKDEQPCEASKEVSTTNRSKFDQETGSSNTLERGPGEDIIVKSPSFLYFPLQMDRTLVRQVVAEALGSFIVMFSIGGIIASTELMRGQVGLLEYAVTAALAVIMVVFSIGHISGAHVNPAVTIAFATVGPFPWKKVPLYIVAHVAGSAIATYAATLVYGMKPEVMTTRPLAGYSAAFWAEFMSTFFVLFLTASLVHAPPSVTQFSGFIVAVGIGLGVLITAPISSGSMNPARSLGPAIVSFNFDGLWIYLTAPILGSVSGAFTLRMLKPCASSTPSSSSSSSRRSQFLQLD